jgi:hypothetical protein
MSAFDRFKLESVSRMMQTAPRQGLKPERPSRALRGSVQSTRARAGAVCARDAQAFFITPASQSLLLST